MQDFAAFTVKTEYKDVVVSPILKSSSKILKIESWKSFKYKDIFEIHNGYYNKRPESTETSTEIPFIGATDGNNGVTGYYSLADIENQHKDERSPEHNLEKKIFQAPSITVSNNGSVGYAFFQKKKFTCTHDVNVLYLKNTKTNALRAMFLCTLIQLERYRWAYGRKWRPSRMPESEIRLPVDKNGSPDWKFMEDYMKSLPYSRNL